MDSITFGSCILDNRLPAHNNNSNKNNTDSACVSDGYLLNCSSIEIRNQTGLRNRVQCTGGPAPLFRHLHASFGQGSRSLIEHREPDGVRASSSFSLVCLPRHYFEVPLESREENFAPLQLSNLYKEPWPSQGATYNFNTGVVTIRMEEDPAYPRVRVYLSQGAQQEPVLMENWSLARKW